MDNAGENKKSQQRAESDAWKFDITFEYIARNTLQQNYLAELGFVVLANKSTWNGGNYLRNVGNRASST